MSDRTSSGRLGNDESLAGGEQQRGSTFPGFLSIFDEVGVEQNVAFRFSWQADFYHSLIPLLAPELLRGDPFTLPFQCQQFLEHLIRCLDRFAVGLKTPLSYDHVGELFGQINVAHLQGPGNDLALAGDAPRVPEGLRPS